MGLQFSFVLASVFLCITSGAKSYFFRKIVSAFLPPCVPICGHLARICG